MSSENDFPLFMFSFPLMIVALLAATIVFLPRPEGTPEQKRKVTEALRLAIPGWRAKALVKGQTYIVKEISFLTMDEIRAVYPHVSEGLTGNVFFHFDRDDGVREAELIPMAKSVAAVESDLV